MPTRFFRRIQIVPGVMLNISKRGISLSLGRRGARFTLSKDGTRKTVGIPGTGLFYTKFDKFGKKRNKEISGPEKSKSGKPNYYLDKVVFIFLKRGYASWPAKIFTIIILWGLIFFPLAISTDVKQTLLAMLLVGIAVQPVILVIGMLNPRLVLQPSRAATAEVAFLYIIILSMGIVWVMAS